MPTAVIGSGCTGPQAQQFATCFATTDAGLNAACGDTGSLGAPDGSLNACGQCIEGTVLVPGEPVPPEWGFELLVTLVPALGDVADGYTVNMGPELGACVYAAGGAEGHACGLDLMAADACTYSLCDPLCPVPQPATPSGPFNEEALAALQNCFSAVAMGACAEFVTKEETDCAALHNISGTGPLDVCQRLVGQADQNPDAGPATAAGYLQLIELACGGGDAGF